VLVQKKSLGVTCVLRLLADQRVRDPHRGGGARGEANPRPAPSETIAIHSNPPGHPDRGMLLKHTGTLVGTLVPEGPRSISTIADHPRWLVCACSVTMLGVKSKMTGVCSSAR